MVHHDPQQKQQPVGHAVGVDRIVHRAPSIDQNVKMSNGDKLKHSTQSSGNDSDFFTQSELLHRLVTECCVDDDSICGDL